MTDFLVRRFVKNYEHIQWTEVRTSYGMLSSSVGIFCNILLFLVKLLVGILMHSIAVTADAFNNLSDAASSVISFVGVRMAGKPADKEHPFGHGRVEYIAAFIVSFFVIQVGFTFFKSSVGKIMQPKEISLFWRCPYWLRYGWGLLTGSWESGLIPKSCWLWLRTLWGMWPPHQ